MSSQQKWMASVWFLSDQVCQEFVAAANQKHTSIKNHPTRVEGTSISLSPKEEEWERAFGVSGRNHSALADRVRKCPLPALIGHSFSVFLSPSPSLSLYLSISLFLSTSLSFSLPLSLSLSVSHSLSRQIYRRPQLQLVATRKATGYDCSTSAAVQVVRH